MLKLRCIRRAPKWLTAACHPVRSWFDQQLQPRDHPVFTRMLSPLVAWAWLLVLQNRVRVVSQ